MKPGSGRRFKPYPAYKDSGVEWLGEIPAHWEVRRLKTIACVDLSNVDKKSMEGQESVKLCNYVDVYYNEHITPDLDFMAATATPEQVRRFSLCRGYVLITKDSESWTDIAVPAVVTADLPATLCGYHLALVRPGSDCDGRFLARAFSAIGPRDQFQIAANGITRFGLGGDAIRTGLFAVPPFNEQRAVAAFLDRETARIDALVAKKERLIELLAEQRAALITRAVTKGLDPTVSMKDSGVEWLGRIPAHWEMKQLKYLVQQIVGIQLGPFGGMLKDLEYQPTPYKVYGQENTIANDFDAGSRWLSEGAFLRLREYELCPADIVLTRKGASIGNSRVVPDGIQRGIIDSDTIRVRVHQDAIDIDFGVLLMHEAYLQTEILAMQKGAVLPGLNTATIANLRVALPPLPEQQAIMCFVRLESKRLHTLGSGIRMAIDRLREYRTALISAAVTGSIDVREELP